MRNRKRFSIAYDTSQFSMNLLRGKRSFHFGLIVPDQIEAIPGNSADAVQNKDSLAHGDTELHRRDEVRKEHSVQ